MKRKKMPIGISSFERIISENYYYVDKTDLIRQIVEETDVVTILPRPRRFGKTLGLSMLRSFFERTDGPSRRELFRGLAIEQWEGFEQHQGRYPVIFFTFKDAKGPTLDNLYFKLADTIAQECDTHASLADADVFNEEERELFKRLWLNRASREELYRAPRLLSKGLSRLYKEQVIILIDEYDTPVQSAYAGGFYNEFIGFMRDFMSSALKDNDDLSRGVVTGIMRVAKESIFSGLNNATVYSILDRKLSTAFGFTQEETDRILDDYGIGELKPDVKFWYDGYLFAGTTIYNPWSILNFAWDDEHLFRPYWVNTASNELLRQMVARSNAQAREELTRLVEKESIVYPVNIHLSFPELMNDNANIWSFMFFTGYLKAEFDHRDSKYKDYYRLSIPNIEVYCAFDQIIQDWFNHAPTSNGRLLEMLEALRQENYRYFETILNEFVTRTLSFFDTGGRQVESVYQAFLLGLLANLADYVVDSNREAGYGRYDIMLLPHDTSRRGFIFELKSGEGEPEKQLSEALAQIRTQKYAERLRQHKVANITAIAVTFDGKRVWMKTEEIR